MVRRKKIPKAAKLVASAAAEAAAISVESVLEQYRARRAWVRYWINFYIADNVGVFYKTVRSAVDVICPTWDGEVKTWLEPGPYCAPAGFFPTPYNDRLLSGVRWRFLGLRSVRNRGKRPLRVWTRDWNRNQLMPNKDWLKMGKITTPEAIEDYQRLWYVINGLDELHVDLASEAIQIRDIARKSDWSLAERLGEYSVPYFKNK